MDNYCYSLPASKFSLKGAILIFRNQMNSAVKLKQNKKKHVLVLIVHRSLKFHELKIYIAHSVDNSSLIIMIIISVELFFVSVIIFYEI